MMLIDWLFFFSTHFHEKINKQKKTERERLSNWVCYFSRCTNVFRTCLCFLSYSYVRPLHLSFRFVTSAVWVPPALPPAVYQSVIHTRPHPHTDNSEPSVLQQLGHPLLFSSSLLPTSPPTPLARPTTSATKPKWTRVNGRVKQRRLLTFHHSPLSHFLKDQLLRLYEKLH